MPEARDAGASESPLRRPGDRLEFVGPYRILRVLAHGGMGVVYAAEQLEPVRRMVAVKVIRAGLASPDIVARFVAERQALAVMEHPNIARVFDGGVTDDGRPYFVMELVKGMALTDYCDGEKLSIRERLGIFIDVCRAVQHAHQKGVIHRDLKPSNVLVMLQDGKPVPKVIDFGVAKALALQLTDEVLVTQDGRAMGTPAYMSPEQAEGSRLDVDTRSDIYSLGVILFELLVGGLPVDPMEMGVYAFMAQLAARESLPSVPSARLGTLGREAAMVSELRRTDSRTLQRELRGDLDWIALKAMEPNRSRRYETVNALVVDIQRYLDHEPITARPPSTLYRLSRFAQRNRTAVVAAVIVTAALVIGLSVAAVGLVKARRAEATARREAATSQQVVAFLNRLFSGLSPRDAQGNALTARELLDRGATRVRAELAGQPLVEAQMLATIGVVYRDIGLLEEAQPLLEQAVAIQSRLLPPGDSTLQASVLELGHLAQRQGRYQVADSLYRQVLDARQRALGPDAPDLATPLSSLGGLYFLLGKPAEAESVLVRAESLWAQSGRPDDAGSAEILRNLGAAYYSLGRYQEAIGTFQRALHIYEAVQGPESPDVGRTLSNLGASYYELKQYDDAELNYVRADSIFIKTLGPGNPNIASININLAEIEMLHRQYAVAERRLHRALDILHATMKPNNPSTGLAEFDLANLLRDTKRVREADTHYERALTIRTAVYGASSASVAEVLEGYATLLRAAGQTARASQMETRAKAIRTAK